MRLSIFYEIGEFIKDYWGKRFYTLIKMIIFIVTVNNSLLVVNVFFDYGLEYTGLLNYYALVVLTIIFGLKDRGKDDD